MVEGARASSKILSTTTKRRVRRPLHRASRGPPPPLSRGRKDKALPVSRRDFCSRASFPATILSNAFPLALFPGFSLCPPRPQTKGEAERRETRRLTRALRARGCPHPDPPPLAGEGQGGGSSPLGVPLRLWPGRQLVPKARHQAMLPRSSPERSILYGRLNREAETLRFSTGITRAGKTNDCPRTASTSHAGRCAGRMMPDAARERVTNPPAGTALAPSQGVSSRRTSLRKARWTFLVRWVVRFKKIRRAKPSL